MVQDGAGLVLIIPIHVTSSAAFIQPQMKWSKETFLVCVCVFVSSKMVFLKSCWKKMSRHSPVFINVVKVVTSCQKLLGLCNCLCLKRMEDFPHKKTTFF